MSVRDNPKPGDQIIQPCGHRLRVTSVGGRFICWERVKPNGELVDKNTWTLRGWREVVCRMAREIPKQENGNDER